MTTVDVERLMSSFLRGETDITDLVGDRVYTELPATKTWPLVRLTLIDESAVFDRPLYLTSSVIQIDAYGGAKVTAREIADTIRSLLAHSFNGTHDFLGVVTGVSFTSMAYDPDESFQPARPRYRFDVTVWAHPLPSNADS